MTGLTHAQAIKPYAFAKYGVRLRDTSRRVGVSSNDLYPNLKTYVECLCYSGQVTAESR